MDSFHVILDTLFLYYGCNKADATPISDNFYPTVMAESLLILLHSFAGVHSAYVLLQRRCSQSQQ